MNNEIDAHVKPVCLFHLTISFGFQIVKNGHRKLRLFSQVSCVIAVKITKYVAKPVGMSDGRYYCLFVLVIIVCLLTGSSVRN